MNSEWLIGGGGKLEYSANRSHFSSIRRWGMARDMALVFESLAEALRAKELIDAAGKPKYWLTFIDRLERPDDGDIAIHGAMQVGDQTR
jgi:hypothetical protein